MEAELFARYWQPVFVFARKKGLDEEAAKDATQGLFLRLLERDFMDKMDREKGRLRSYLRSSMSHYLADEYRKKSSLKRGGAYQLESLDEAWVDRCVASSDELSPEQAYERSWAHMMMERSFSRLTDEYQRGTRKGPLALVIESFRGDSSRSQAEIALEHGMSTSQLKSFLFRARSRFQEILKSEIGETVEGEDAMQSETALVRENLR